MYFIELRYTNGRSFVLPQPYNMWQEAYEALLRDYPTNAKYSAGIVSY